ncbi:MAG: hypothetical protein DLM73_10180 [Chthoniobacterales bacterium]|nr:MAG: hypothetical protein DLM73_10180 [Chthoniobacterales bacterium]
MTLGISAVTLIGTAVGELPPWVYKERQIKAPESLVIKVRSVVRTETAEADGKSIAFKVIAEVEKVERTSTRLMPGAVIEIRYLQHNYSQPMAGPSEVPALKEGQVCPAYLESAVEGRSYSPAAGGFSFTQLD